MITELIMLAVVAIFFYFASRITKRIKPFMKSPQRFLVYYLIGCGIAIFSYVMRMFLVEYGAIPPFGVLVQDNFSIPALFYKFGGILHITGFLCAAVFTFLLFGKISEKRGKYIIIALLIISIPLFGLLPLQVEQIPVEPYEIFVNARTEYILPRLPMLIFAAVIVLLLISVLVWIMNGIKASGGQRKKCFFFAFGFLTMFIAALLDGFYPDPAMLFLWRILYGISGGITYFAFKIKV